MNQLYGTNDIRKANLWERCPGLVFRHSMQVHQHSPTDEEKEFKNAPKS